MARSSSLELPEYEEGFLSIIPLRILRGNFLNQHENQISESIGNGNEIEGVCST